MDVRSLVFWACDLPGRVARRVTGRTADYREFLFDDVVARLGARRPSRILEIGPKDGADTRRLCSLGPNELTLVDLPNQKERIQEWLPNLNGCPIELIIGNIMYDRAFEAIKPFDLVWCTGVLYHNPEQLRFIRQLYDLTADDGMLVLETATARRPRTREENCVELWYPPDEATSDSYHLSVNITHLPSRKAVESWLSMIGFSDVERSSCHRKVSRGLAATRAAYIACRRPGRERGTYYGIAGLDYRIGEAR